MELNRKQLAKILLIIAAAMLMYGVVQNVGAVLSALRGIFSLLSPIILGLCIAFILHIPMNFIEAKVFPAGAKGRLGKVVARIRRPVSLIASLLLLLLIVTVFLLLILPEARDAIMLIGQSLPDQIDSVLAAITAQVERLGIAQLDLTMLNIDWGNVGSALIKRFSDSGAAVINQTIGLTSTVIRNIFNFVLAFVFALYVLATKDQLSIQIRRVAYALLPEKAAKSILDICTMSSQIFSRFVVGQCAEAVILGVLCFIGMAIFAMPYAVMISSLVAITALIPVFGAFIGTGAGVLLIFLQSPGKALWFLVFMLILQQLEGNLIYPKVVGSSVGLPGLWVLVAVTLGGSLWGTVGMLLSVPLCAVAYSLAREGIAQQLKKKKIKPNQYQ